MGRLAQDGALVPALPGRRHSLTCVAASSPARRLASKPLTNADVADRLRQAARILRQQKANPFRVNAYTRAAATVESLDEELSTLLERKGLHAIEALPGIGHGIAAAIREMTGTGRWSQLDRLRGDANPLALFMSIPGIGPDLSRRICNRLDIGTLEELEVAAHDGRLADVPGVGRRRLEMVRAGLAAALGRPLRRPAEGAQPGIDQLLSVDSEYREKAEAGKLRFIAPKRFNPSGEAWLPILHTQRGEWHFTVLFSNTARAHELGKTRDWVIIYFYDQDQRESQCTVVTERFGDLRGRRVVRGREAECARHYQGGRVARM